MLSYLRRWNYWRKRCRNGFIHKLLVLFKIKESPTFNMTIDPKEWEEFINSFQKDLSNIQSPSMGLGKSQEGLIKEHLVKLNEELYNLAQRVKK